MPDHKVFLCLHGHFYQPPRENPWMEEIEIQESAAPFHDWNDRIHHECYLPNAMARVLDDRGFMVDIVNNYEHMSFNFGPTLMSWIREKHPETYLKIVSADHRSRETHHGHGNAIAQVYNHIILPLANLRDKRTQILWGIEDFRCHFGRAPESVWIPETACNGDTLEALMEFDLRYIILNPHQAEGVRPIGGHDWQDVSWGSIDPKMPYRIFSKTRPEKFIDVFFYDGPISREVGFGDLAFDAKRFASHLEWAKANDAKFPQLIHAATDGETFGHHKPFGDRVLAYLLNVEAVKHGFRVTNYGEFLDLCPPQFEVRLKPGENGEGTSWSCAHGIRRWKEHCGCRGGGPEEWSQHWRKPLREALDWLRDELAKIFEAHGAAYFQDVWEARNQYIAVVLDRSEKNVQEFFDRVAKRPLQKSEMVLALKLLEIQRQAMLMYTSCGWFFTEISGIETVQILQYAARAIELVKDVTGASRDIEEKFLNKLALAKSNIPAWKDGRGIYEKLVLPCKASVLQIVSAYAIGSVFDDYYGGKESLRLYASKLDVLYQRKESFGNLTLNFGRVHLTSQVTFEENHLMFIVAQIGLYDFRCSIKPFLGMEDFEKTEKELFDSLKTHHLVDLLRKIDDAFGENYFALKDLPLRDRVNIISYLTREVIEKIGVVYENLYDENRRMNEIYRAINLPIPEQVRYAVEHTLRRRLNAAVEQLAAAGFNPKKATPLYRVIEAAQSFDVDLTVGTDEVAAFLSTELALRGKKLFEEVKPEIVKECLYLLALAEKIGIELNLREAQDPLFFLLKRWIQNPAAIPESAQASESDLLQLMGALKIETEALRKVLRKS